MSISQETRDKAAALVAKAKLVKNGEVGSVEFASSAYEDSMDDGVTVEMAKKVHANNVNFVNAVTLAVGSMALDAVKEDSSVKTITGETSMGKDRVEVQWHAEQTHRNPSTGESITKYGACVAKVSTQAGKNGGEHKHIRNELSEKGKELTDLLKSIK